jgi:FtsH-binding integral membrane protein
MNAWNRNTDASYPVVSPVDLQSVMRQVYVWMVFGLLVTAGLAYVTVATPLINLAANPIVLMVALVGEFGLVLVISLGFNRLSAGAATALFFAYAALNGFTLAVVLLAFSVQSVFLTFAATAALFGAMSIVGYTTHLDLSRMGTFLIMGVIGLVIATVVNVFVNSGPLDFLISIAGVLIFTGLTAYDTQRIGRMAAQMSPEGEAGIKFGIMGALRLYLDFINMFLFMLRLSGRRR